MDAKQKAYSEWLVLRCQQGDRSALNKLLALWTGRYFAFARYRLGNREAAQDVLQEALVAICRSLHKLADPASFPRWSFTIVERRCVDWQRKQFRDRQHLEQHSVIGEPENSSAAEVSATDASLDSKRLLSLLAPELQSLVRLYYLEELTISEIAEILDIAPGTVKSRLFYARKKLVAMLRERQQEIQSDKPGGEP